jgi:hypothetical protein
VEPQHHLQRIRRPFGGCRAAINRGILGQRDCQEYQPVERFAI